MKIIRLVLIAIFLPNFIFTQQTNWKTFSMENTGFPYRIPNDLLIDANADILLGVGFGLTEFDGTHWLNQNQSNSNIPLTYIDQIYEYNGKIFCSGNDTVRTAPNTIESEERFAVYDNGVWTSYNLEPVFTVANNNKILDFIVDNSGNIFCISTNFPNNFYQISADSLHQITNPNDQYWHGEVLEMANDGGIWIGRNGDISGIYKYENGQIDSIYFPIPADTINGIVDMKEDSNGNLWLLGYDRLVKFSNGSFSVFKNFPIGFQNPLGYYFNESNLEIDSANNFWFGSKLNGLYKFNFLTMQWSRFDVANPFIASTSTTNDNITRVKILSNSEIYLLGEIGLYKFNGSQVVKRWGTDNTGMPGNTISSIFIDAHQHIWISDLNDGFAMYNGDKWTTYSPMELFNKTVLTLHDITVTPSGNIWLADDSLRYFLDNSWHSISDPSTYDSYSTVAYDQNNKIWIGSDYGGLFEYENGNFTHFSNSVIMGSSINKIFVDHQNNIWVGFQNSGISKFDGSNWTNFNINDGLLGNFVTDISEDNNGNIWITLWEKGIAKYDGSSWTSFNKSNSGIQTDDARHIACDNNNAVWIGTSDSGLIKYDGNNWTTFNNDNSPLTRNFITDVTIDDNNNKWIGVNGDANYPGLFVYNENGVVVDVKYNANKMEVPTQFALSQNYPNPFNPSTTINYSLPESGNVTLKIFDILGQEVATLVNKKQIQGNYEVKFNAGELSSGIYFYRLKTDNFSKTNKMMLLK